MKNMINREENGQSNDKLGSAIDRLDNCAHALLLKMPDNFHVKQLSVLLPEVVKELKAGFVEATGENPWEFES
jgi:hypothetical protein